MRQDLQGSNQQCKYNYGKDKCEYHKPTKHNKPTKTPTKKPHHNKPNKNHKPTKKPTKKPHNKPNHNPSHKKVY